MLAYTYVEPGKFELQEKPKPRLKDSRDAIVRVTLGSICTSDLHIKHGSVPRAVPGVTVGHEMVGVVEDVGEDVIGIKPGDRVTVNVETFFVANVSSVVVGMSIIVWIPMAVGLWGVVSMAVKPNMFECPMPIKV